MSYFNMVCDVCGRGVPGITWVNGMKFCAKCYQETFNNKLYFTNETGKFVDLLNTEMYELKISNLEHKLDEKDQRIAELEEQLKNAIVPKFKPYDNFYTINDLNHIVCRGCIHIIIYNDRIAYVDTYGAEYECDFGKEMQQGLYTKEEAQAKLRELGEKK